MTEDEYHTHLSRVRYFWQEYENPTLYAEWENIKSEIEKCNPEIIRAWKRYMEK